MIGLAWSISFILWAPAILFWQYIVGKRSVQPNECYIQFLSEPIITFCTAIAAFYLPVTIMAVLFWKIYQETEKRAKDVQGLKGSGSGNSPTQAQNQGSDSGISARSVPNKQGDLSAMLCHMGRSQNRSSYELNQTVSEMNKNNADVQRGLGCKGTCGPFLPHFLSCLPGQYSSRRSVIHLTTMVGDAERSRCDIFMNNEACGTGNQSEERAGRLASIPSICQYLIFSYSDQSLKNIL